MSTSTTTEEGADTGAALIAWRARMGFSQRDACEALGCSRGALGHWEQGTHKVPKYIGLACAALTFGAEPYGEGT